jgi:hypothetical protein
MQHADREDRVERPVAERQAEHVGLDDGHVGPAAHALLRRFDRERQVDADHRGTPPRRHVEKAPRAAADVEHQLAAQVVGR